MPPRASDVHQQAVYGRPDRQSPLHEGLALARDEAMREFIEFAMGEPLPTNRAVTSADFNIPADENLVKKLAVMGLATLAYRARRGDTRSAMYLVDRCLGTPDKPFVEKVANMNLSEAQKALKTELLDSGISEKLADQMVESFSQQRTRPGKQNRVNVATHEE